MSSSPVKKLMFMQGNKCFFCKKTMSLSEASVDHLMPKSKGGTNSFDNCVACCKSLNSLFGNISLKEKVQIIINQNGKFKCPN